MPAEAIPAPRRGDPAAGPDRPAAVPAAAGDRGAGAARHGHPQQPLGRRLPLGDPASRSAARCCIAIAFSLMLRAPPLGTSFILFYATGTIPFRLYSAMAGAVAGAINANRGLLAYPVVNPLDAVFAQFVLGFMTDVLVAVGDLRRHRALHRRRHRPRPRPGRRRLRPRGAARARGRHGQLRALRLLPDLEERLVGAVPAAVPDVGDPLSLRQRADRVPAAALVEPDGARDRADALGLLRQLRPDLRLGALRARRRRRRCSWSAAGCSAGTRAS